MTHGYQAKSKLFGFKLKLPENKIYNTNLGIYSYEKVVFNTTELDHTLNKYSAIVDEESECQRRVLAFENYYKIQVGEQRAAIEDRDNLALTPFRVQELSALYQQQREDLNRKLIHIDGLNREMNGMRVLLREQQGTTRNIGIALRREQQRRSTAEQLLQRSVATAEILNHRNKQLQQEIDKLE